MQPKLRRGSVAKRLHMKVAERPHLKIRLNEVPQDPLSLGDVGSQHGTLGTRLLAGASLLASAGAAHKPSQ